MSLESMPMPKSIESSIESSIEPGNDDLYPCPQYLSIYTKSKKFNIFNKSSVKIVGSNLNSELNPGTIGRVIHQFAFLLDVTGSMQAYIDGTKDQIVKLMSTLKQNCIESMESLPDYKAGSIELQFEVALIAYRDFCDTKHFETVDFTTDTKNIEDYLATISASGGGDAPEDVQGAFIHSVFGINVNSPKLTWETDENKDDIASRTILWLADAPCHGNEFTGFEVERVVGNEKKYMDEWRLIFDEMQRLKTSLYLVKVTNETVKSNNTLKDLAKDKVSIVEIDISQAVNSGHSYASGGARSGCMPPAGVKKCYPMRFSDTRSELVVLPSSDKFDSSAAYENIRTALKSDICMKNMVQCSTVQSRMPKKSDY